MAREPKVPKPKPDKRELNMRVGPFGSLHPAAPYDEDCMSRFRQGDIVRIIEPTFPRNDSDDELRRKYRALVSRLAKATGIDHDVLHLRMRTKTGRVASFTVSGEDAVHWVPISTTEMSPPQFEAFYKDFEQVLLEDYDLTPDQIFDLAAEELTTRLRNHR